MTTKNALITGAGQRMGRVLALALAEQGYDIVVHYGRSEDGAKATVDEITDMGRKAVAVQADLIDEDATAGLIDAAVLAIGGPLSVLINNASVFENDRFETATRDAWDRHMATNLRAPFVLTQCFAAQVPGPELDANDEPVAMGVVINMGDHWAGDLAPEFASYAIAKSAVEGLTEISARALAGRVRVNAIGPGPTIKGTRQRQEHFDEQRRAIKSGRGSNPEDIVAAVNFLLSSKAVTGTFLKVDGGLHLGWLPGVARQDQGQN